MTWPEAVLGVAVCVVVIVAILAVSGFEVTWGDGKRDKPGGTK